MARLTRRLCNGREWVKDKERESKWNRLVVPQATANPVCARSPREKRGKKKKKSATRDANRPPSAFPRGPPMPELLPIVHPSLLSARRAESRERTTVVNLRFLNAVLCVCVCVCVWSVATSSRRFVGKLRKEERAGRSRAKSRLTSLALVCVWSLLMCLGDKSGSASIYIFKRCRRLWNGWKDSSKLDISQVVAQISKSPRRILLLCNVLLRVL